MKQKTPLKPIFFIYISIIIIMFFFCFKASAQTLAENQIEAINPNEYNPFTLGQITSPNITFSGIGRSSDIIGYNANNRYNASNWTTDELDEDKYFFFTITPNEGYFIEFISFNYTSQASGSGPEYIAIRSSIDDFEADIGTATLSGTNIDLSDVMYQNISTQIEFRIYTWGATHNDGTFSINNFNFNGHVFDENCPVPSAAKLITGPTSADCYQKGVVYSVETINRAYEYEWIIPNGASIVSGNKTNSITVDFGDETGNIVVYGTNSCGNGSPSSALSVSVEYPIIYLHDFGYTDITTHPYTEYPLIFDDKLSNSIWTNSTETWKSYAGATGLPDRSIASDSIEGSPVFTLKFDINAGYQLKITSFNFWRRSSSTGPTLWELFANNILMGSGTSSTSYSYIGQTPVENVINSITGTVIIDLSLNGATKPEGTFRLDDFTLYGMVDCIPVYADNPDDVSACGHYTLPALSSGNYFSETMGNGNQYFENDIIISTKKLYIYIESVDAPECFDENSFTITIHPIITTNVISRVK